MATCVLGLFLLLLASLSCSSNAQGDDPCNCECCHKLLAGQFFCLDPEIDEYSQAETNCDSETRRVNVTCYPVPGSTCPTDEGQERPLDRTCFYRTQPCRYVRGQRYNLYVAVSLSLFLGIFGIDRFYLGYPALGLLKLCTVGFFFVGYIIDFLLIATQTVGPADRSDYYAPFYGPALIRVRS